MLPNGIAGFRDLKDPYIPEQEKRVFQRFCYSIAIRYHCEVLSFDLDLASKNFYFAEIKTEQGRFYLTDPSVNVLTLAELEQNWHDIVGELSKAELEQIKYWKPNIMGDIIFNFWD